ncbi:MAG: hypothetical protein A3K19_05065 [Lentisphaerae bacterium RIFOXYB12_FULL_65_16]|nr:MAG: hypothetical protein A3K18_35285 [Lentisphaerae bacterium RIFOXYA12_64_32]OGV89759.1 MAG: hypothetical protein A3K19_05065 [Lentisphaerae bacterium RIFOXYB12_FULL_65_16]
MARIPIGLELYSVRHDLDKDVYGTLKAVKAMGYEGVEFAGPPKHSAPVLRAILDEVGLVCCGWHVPFDMLKDDKLASTIAYHKIVGNRRLVVPWLPAKTRAEWEKMVPFFNELADKLAVHDMMTGYHNHNVEFTAVDGATPWDVFFSGTERRVIMQLDTGNAYSGEGEPVTILKKYPGRANSVHLKPFSRTAAKEDRKFGFRPIIGEDELDWAEIFRLSETIGNTDWYVVEYESDAFAPMEAVDRCLKALKKMGK